MSSSSFEELIQKLTGLWASPVHGGEAYFSCAPPSPANLLKECLIYASEDIFKCNVLLEKR